jgi:TolA-binding protein
LENGQGELAIPNLQEFLRTKREPRYAVAGYGLLGSALETAKRPTEAAQAYLSASQAAEYDFLKAEYLLEAGRASTTAGKTEDAIRAYKQVTDQFAKTPANTEAAVRLAELTGGLQ